MFYIARREATVTMYCDKAGSCISHLPSSLHRIFFEPRKYYETFIGATMWSEAFDEFMRFSVPVDRCWVGFKRIKVTWHQRLWRGCDNLPTWTERPTCLTLNPSRDTCTSLFRSANICLSCLLTIDLLTTSAIYRCSS